MKVLIPRCNFRKFRRNIYFKSIYTMYIPSIEENRMMSEDMILLFCILHSNEKAEEK